VTLGWRSKPQGPGGGCGGESGGDNVADRKPWARQLRDRLFREIEKTWPCGRGNRRPPDVHRVGGRGELHLASLMETMRREGFEFQVAAAHHSAGGAERGAAGAYEEL